MSSRSVTTSNQSSARNVLAVSFAFILAATFLGFGPFAVPSASSSPSLNSPTVVKIEPTKKQPVRIRVKRLADNIILLKAVAKNRKSVIFKYRVESAWRKRKAAVRVRQFLPSGTTKIWLRTAGTRWAKIKVPGVNSPSTGSPDSNTDTGGFVSCLEAAEANTFETRDWLAANCGWFKGGESGGTSWLFPTNDKETYRPENGLTIHATGEVSNCWWFADEKSPSNGNPMLFAEVTWSIPLEDEYFKDLGRVNVMAGGIIPGWWKNQEMVLDEAKQIARIPVTGKVAHPTTYHDILYLKDKVWQGETVYLEAKSSGSQAGDTTPGFEVLLSWETVAAGKKEANFEQYMLGLEDGSRVEAVGVHHKYWLPGGTSVNIDHPYYYNIVTQSVPLDISQCHAEPSIEFDYSILSR